MTTVRPRLGRTLAALVLSLVASAASAGGEALQERVRNVLAPPDAILRHAERLQLGDNQQARLRALIERAADEANRLQDDADVRAEVVVELLETRPGDREDVMRALERAHAADGALKRVHLLLWIDANELLTLTQRRKAIALAAAERAAAAKKP